METPEPPKASETPKNETVATRRTKAPSKYDLPSERFDMETHFTVLRRFMSASSNGAEPVAAAKVEGNGLRQQAAVLNAAFLTDIGLLERVSAGVFKPTPAALELLTARSVSAERARPVLHRLIEKSWFAEVARSALNTRPVMPEKELLGDLSVAAQTVFDKKERALRVLLDYLVFAGIVVRTEDGSYSLGNGSSPSPGPTPTSSVLEFSTTVDVPPTSGPADSTAKYETIQTNDFFLRIRVSKDSMADLKDHLAIVERKIKRALGEV
jgi:hypothetical protein